MTFPRPPLLRTFLRPATPRARSFHTNTPLPIPPRRPESGISTHEEFLGAIGRGAAGKVKVESWEGLFGLTGQGMKQAGVGVHDRRYILWALEKYRQGGNPKEFAIPPKPKKTIRGWGPSVQNGKRIR
ncbi:hypothetical protein DACRYDRAFT_101820 [Dacryopinax primogenitus]|uniref:Small ribosomal subunit protein mS41 n=1 Tax=Dacryopinax primogenitus (strain DJM 731) TaxID=1858805 RepID=M5FZ16_DACPD|nr:uncharacterized protein DACRYDRAFT_101820 [Dacryopinax primogenitus]EJT98821.1 hypothetical protein DACRYDRAFT_101820 [Dacryopinax primogenitus]